MYKATLILGSQASADPVSDAWPFVLDPRCGGGKRILARNDARYTCLMINI
jgi:hypothetical protein